MNISVYLFGEFSVGYSQYPNDYAKIIFESFAKSAQATTQITIHRDGDLMYYGYIRKMENAEYLGGVRCRKWKIYHPIGWDVCHLRASH